MNKISKQISSIRKQLKASNVLQNYYDDKIQKRKNALIEIFDEILKHGKPMRTSGDFKIFQIYDILTDSFKDISQYAWINDDTEKSYYEAINKLKPINDNNWANFIPNLSKDDYYFFKGDGNQTYNLYYTFQFADLQDVKKFVNFITNIIEECLSEYQVCTTGVFFQFKTHRYLQSLISHSDTFKVFYYDKELKSQIQNYIQRRISHYGLKKAQRPYFSGKDVKQINDALGDFFSGKITKQQYDAIKNNTGSFGQRLSKNISQYIIKCINNTKQKHPNVTAEQIYNGVKKMFYNFVQKFVNELQ